MMIVIAPHAHAQADMTQAPGSTIRPILQSKANARVQLEPVITKSIGWPLRFLGDADADANGRLYLIDLLGDIWTVSPTGELSEDPFLKTPTDSGLERSDGDYGLLSLALHPDFLEAGQPGYGKLYTLEAVEPTNPLFGPPDFHAPNIGKEQWGHPKVFEPAHHSQLIEYTVNPTLNNVPLEDANRRVLLSLHQPHHSHNLGDLVFDPHGLLIFSSADGGNGTGYELNSNTVDNLYGKLGRIDPLTLQDTDNRRVWRVNGEPRFSVPTDNPHFDEADGIGPADMVLAYGIRNAFRLSIDGDWLYFSDTGQNHVESFDRMNLPDVLEGRSRGDFGWGLLEGSFVYLGDANTQYYADTDNQTQAGDPVNEYLPTALSVALDQVSNPNHEVHAVRGSYLGIQKRGEDHTYTRRLTPEEIDRTKHATLPMFEYDHNVGISAIGGYVYRGTAIPELQGMYVFAEFQGAGKERDRDGRNIGKQARLFYGNPDADPASPDHGLIHEMRIAQAGLPLPHQLIGFGEDADGELILTGFNFTDTGVEGVAVRFTTPSPGGGDYGNTTFGVIAFVAVAALASIIAVLLILRRSRIRKSANP